MVYWGSVSEWCIGGLCLSGALGSVSEWCIGGLSDWGLCLSGALGVCV